MRKRRRAAGATLKRGLGDASLYWGSEGLPTRREIRRRARALGVPLQESLG